MKYTAPARAATAIFKEFKKKTGLCFDDSPLKTLDKGLEKFNEKKKKYKTLLLDLKKAKDTGTLNSLYKTLHSTLGGLRDRSYIVYQDADHAKNRLCTPVVRNLGVAGGVEAWRGFLKSLPKGWSVEIQETGKWFNLKVPVKSFTQEWKGATATFDWIQITISVTERQSALFHIGFQPRKTHKGTAPSPHPHVDRSGLCEGNAHSALYEAKKSWNIIGLYAVLHALLVTPNYGGHSYYVPEDFTGIRGGRCKECGWWFTIETLKEGGKCSACSSYLCSKCVKKIEKRGNFSSCPKCATAEKSKLRRERKTQKGEKKKSSPSLPPIMCGYCKGKGLHYCESSVCRGKKGESSRGERVICGRHGKNCQYCGRVLCLLCQTDYKCKICKEYYCGRHIEKDSGCCNSCEISHPDKVEVYRKQKKRKTKTTKSLKNKERKNITITIGDDNDPQTTTNVATTTYV